MVLDLERWSWKESSGSQRSNATRKAADEEEGMDAGVLAGGPDRARATEPYLGAQAPTGTRHQRSYREAWQAAVRDSTEEMKPWPNHWKN